MEGAAKQPNYQFNIYTYENNVQTDHLGGADDLASAAVLAAAFFTAKQSAYPSTNVGVGVDKDEVGLVAYIGWHIGD